MMQATQGSGATPPAKTPPHRGSNNLGLSCRECQRKKIKCDRRYPCTACSRAGNSCTPSARKPRAKIGAKAVDAELRHRIAKLEQLVETFHKSDEPDQPQAPVKIVQPLIESLSEAGHRSESISSNSSEPRNALEPTSPASSKYVAASFWSSLTAEVQALKGVFEEDGALSDEEVDSIDVSPLSSDSSQPMPNPADGGYELLFCPPGELFVMPGALSEPDAAMAEILANSYIVNVECMYRLLHIPTLRALVEGKPYLGQPACAPCNKALVAAVLFGGATTLTSDESQLFFGKPRDQIVRQCRNAVDIRLSQADPLNTTDIATLQAMCIYVGAIRVIDPSRRAWSMTALLVRIGRALYLHKEVPGLSVFNTELRRRLWYSMIYLDCYSVFDRGSDPLIDINSFTTQLPLNINDADIDESSNSVVPRSDELTDMTFARVMCDAAKLVIQIGSQSASHETWQQRLQRAHAYQTMVRTELIPYLNPELRTHAHWIEIADATIHSVILRAIRPVEVHLASSQPRVDSPWVLELAVNILRYADSKGKFSSDMPWRRMPWVPWHAIAVTLAGLCSTKDTPLAEEAWTLVDKAMARWEIDIADSSGGMLWKPIIKIYRKALRFRNEPTASSLPEPAEINETLPDLPLDAQLQEPSMESLGVYPTTGVGASQVLSPDTVSRMAVNLGYTDPLMSFGPGLQGSLPEANVQDDSSWWDWENIMRDMDGVTTDFSLPTS